MCTWKGKSKLTNVFGQSSSVPYIAYYQSDKTLESQVSALEPSKLLSYI